jgi:hypothetical protein
MPRSRMCGAVPSLPKMPSFCGAQWKKAQGQFYLFTFTLWQWLLQTGFIGCEKNVSCHLWTVEANFPRQFKNRNYTLPWKHTGRKKVSVNKTSMERVKQELTSASNDVCGNMECLSVLNFRAYVSLKQAPYCGGVTETQRQMKRAWETETDVISVPWHYIADRHNTDVIGKSRKLAPLMYRSTGIITVQEKGQKSLRWQEQIDRNLNKYTK